MMEQAIFQSHDVAIAASVSRDSEKTWFNSECNARLLGSPNRYIVFQLPINTSTQHLALKFGLNLFPLLLPQLSQMPVADQFYVLAFNELASLSVGENQKFVVAVLPRPCYRPNLWVISAQV